MKKPNARERILETAGRLFFEKGYSEVGINEIIEKAGTAKASFYQYYPSKESLCEAWLQSVHDNSEIFRLELLKKCCSPIEKLACYFDHLEKFLVHGGFRGCPYSNTAAVSDEYCSGIAGQIQTHKESIREFFRAISALQFSNPEKAVETGDRIFILYSGATSEAQNLKAIWPVHVAKSAALEMLGK